MSTTATTLTGPPTLESVAHPHPVRRTTLIYGALAAVVTTAAAAAAHAGGVSLEVDGETIPIAGFAELTVLGGLLAATLNRFSTQPRRWLVRVAIVLIALSCIPSVALPPDVATKATLVATHLIAALVLVPALARQTRR